MDQGSAPLVAGFRPIPAGLAGRAVGDPIGPDDREGTEIEALFILSPPAMIQRDRTEQIDGMINLARDQQGGIDIAGIGLGQFRRPLAITAV